MRISKRRVFAYIGLSIIADFLIVIAPALVFLTVSQLGTEGLKGIAEMIAPLLRPEIRLPLAFVSIVLHQGLVYLRLVFIRQLDHRYFHEDAERVLTRYKATDHYLAEHGEHVRRAWISKNLARNVRHTSEAMQAQLKMVPDLISLMILLGLLAGANWVTALAVLPAKVVTGILLVSQSRKILICRKIILTACFPLSPAA